VCNVNVVNRISCFCLVIFFLRRIGGGFGHPGHPLATPLHYCSFFYVLWMTKTSTLELLVNTPHITMFACVRVRVPVPVLLAEIN